MLSLQKLLLVCVVWAPCENITIIMVQTAEL